MWRYYLGDHRLEGQTSLTMSKFHLLTLLMGVLLVSVPFTRNTAFASEDEDDEEDAVADDVVVLTTSNFDEIIAKSKFALVRSCEYLAPCPAPDDITPLQVEFYAPWCGHCKVRDRNESDRGVGGWTRAPNPSAPRADSCAPLLQDCHGAEGLRCVHCYCQGIYEISNSGS